MLGKTCFCRGQNLCENCFLYLMNFQNIHDCKICTKNVEACKVPHILSSKLYTSKKPVNRGKVKLYTELSTLSTNLCVDYYDLHNKIKNIGFVYML